MSQESAAAPITGPTSEPSGSKLKQFLRKLDFAAQPVPHTVDPALDPANQHEHKHRVHAKQAAHDDGTRYVDAEVPGREDAVEPKPDTEKQVEVQSGSYGTESVSLRFSTPNERFQAFMRRNRWIYSLFFGLLFTAWWISIIAQKKHRHEWLIPTFIWLFLMIRLITFYVPTRPILVALNWVYQRTFIPVRNLIPQKMWPLAELAVSLTLIIVSTFATPVYSSASTRGDRAVSFAGYCLIYIGFFVFSRYKSYIKWHTVFTGMFMQFVVALFVLRTDAGYDFFNWIAFLARELLSFAKKGVAFLLSDEISLKAFFLLTTIPAVIFFIAFIHIFYYHGIIQWAIGKFAYGLYWAMDISGAEAVVAAASPFIGQGESAILVKPFLKHMTDAELYQILTSGFATVSGSVLSSYINMGLSPQALITSCVMSIPASIAGSKLIFPETEQPLSANSAVVPEDTTEKAENTIHAFSNGAWVGLQIGLSILTNVMCIIALISLIDALLTYFGKFWGIPALTLEQIMGYIFYPVAFLLGVTDTKDIYPIARLLGIKIIQNEFVAYGELMSNEGDYATISTRSKLIATYALCGFSNLGSMSIQIGVLGQLAPNRRGRIAQLCLSSLFVGMFVTYSSACVAGMLMADMSRYDSLE